eukprot:m51a1_g3595 hypothetical protein (598) ;mRNA; r:1176176-1179089
MQGDRAPCPASADTAQRHDGEQEAQPQAEDPHEAQQHEDPHVAQLRAALAALDAGRLAEAAALAEGAEAQGAGAGGAYGPAALLLRSLALYDPALLGPSAPAAPLLAARARALGPAPRAAAERCLAALEGAAPGSPAVAFVRGSWLSHVRGDWPGATRCYRAAADAGCVGARNALGVRLEAAGDVAEAARCYRAAGDAGHVAALVNLAALLQRGRPDAGVPRDGPEAARLFERAARAGHADAMCALAGICEAGGDPARALRLYRSAARLGSARGQHGLGVMLAYGRGADPADPEGPAGALEARQAEGVAWIRRAAEQGDAQALERLGDLYWFGDGGLRADLEAALAWYRRAAAAGSAVAKCSVAYAYETGQGAARDLAQAVRWYSEAAGEGEPHADYCLANMLHWGKGLSRDDAEAARRMRSAADRGHAGAMSRLGKWLLRGAWGLERDAGEGLRLMQRAASRGDEEARCRLAKVLSAGVYVPLDMRQASAIARELQDRDPRMRRLAQSLVPLCATTALGALKWNRGQCRIGVNSSSQVGSGTLTVGVSVSVTAPANIGEVMAICLALQNAQLPPPHSFAAFFYEDGNNVPSPFFHR